jgi:ketosteroid isomerase-like protein
MDIQRISDEIEIAALLNKYARAVDTKDWTLYQSLFTEDAHIDSSAAGLTVGTRDEVADFLSQHQAGMTMSMHYVTNIESQIDGDVAQVLAMWYNVVRLPKASQNSYFGGRWRHQMVRTSDGWRSRSLRLEVVWS